jgi:hypothetical protein
MTIETERDDDFDEDEGFWMSNLPPRATGLPMVVFVSQRGRARHDIRIKVSLTHGNHMDPGNTVPVGVRPAPHEIVPGQLSRSDRDAVFRWITLNEAVLIDYWNNQIFTDEMLARIAPLSPPVLP